MENKKIEHDKIKPFPTLEEREERVRKKVSQEAADCEKESEQVDESDKLLNKIIGQLKEEGIWEEEFEEEGLKNEDFKDPFDEGDADLIEFLSREDQKALYLGRKMLEEHRAERRKKWKKYVVGAAALMLCFCAVRMSSEANRRYVAGVVNSITGWGLNIRIRNEENVKPYTEDMEQVAYDEIANTLNIRVPKLQYSPKGMYYVKYVLDSKIGVAKIFFEYEEEIVTIYAYKKGGNYTVEQQWEGEQICVVENVNGQSIGIWRIDNYAEKSTYMSQLENEEAYYNIWGKVEKKEFEKIIENIFY